MFSALCRACCHRGAPKICLLLYMQLLTSSQYAERGGGPASPRGGSAADIPHDEVDMQHDDVDMQHDDIDMQHDEVDM